MTRASNRTEPTWEQFGLRHNWGKQQANEHLNKSKKGKEKRLTGKGRDISRMTTTIPSQRKYHATKMPNHSQTRW